jgi:EAL domain-containing protein (putative c-di-GMP-specific phosphodiesterase class I)
MIPPDQLISLAEQTGLIKSLTLWVLNEALRQRRVWCDLGLDVQMSVNVSARNLNDPELPRIVAQSMERWEVPADSLKLEVTETTVMVEPFRAVETLRRLRETGVHIAIDDFGTGHSSLAYLKHLPVDEIKIDRSFVTDLETGDSDGRIVRATIGLGHELGLRAVAEGVETAAALHELRAYGCDLVQGYYLSRPLDPEACTAWLQSWRERASHAPPRGEARSGWDTDISAGA